MAKKPTDTQLQALSERMVALLRNVIREMRREDETPDETVEKLEELLGVYVDGFEKILGSNLTIRIILRERCEALRRQGKNETRIKALERLLDRNLDLTDDWHQKDGVIAEVMHLLVAASMRYRDLARSPPVRRR